MWSQDLRAAADVAVLAQADQILNLGKESAHVFVLLHQVRVLLEAASERPAG